MLDITHWNTFLLLPVGGLRQIEVHTYTVLSAAELHLALYSSISSSDIALLKSLYCTWKISFYLKKSLSCLMKRKKVLTLISTFRGFLNVCNVSSHLLLVWGFIYLQQSCLLYFNIAQKNNVRATCLMYLLLELKTSKELWQNDGETQVKLKISSTILWCTDPQHMNPI